MNALVCIYVTCFGSEIVCVCVCVCVRVLQVCQLLRRVVRESLKLNSVALVRERTIPTERPPPVGEVSANFCG